MHLHAVMTILENSRKEKEKDIADFSKCIKHVRLKTVNQPGKFG